MHEIDCLIERKMWFFILLPWIFSVSTANNGVSNQRVATADAFRAKCDSLAYRSRIVDGVCYFAINNNIGFEHGNLACNKALSGASMYFDKSRERVIKDLFLDPSKFHDVTTSGKSMNVLCSLEARFSCDQGELGLPGRCIVRSDKPVTFSEARNFCRDKGARSVAIRNEYENKVFTGYLNKNEAGWLEHKHEDGKWSIDGEPVDYWRWFFDGQTPKNLKCSEEQHAVLTSTAKDTCSSYGRWKVDDSNNKNVALCIKQADCLFCPQPEKPAPDCSSSQIRDRAKNECVDCPDGLLPNDAKTKCEERIACESFVSIPGEIAPCYCETRTKGRLTTNGLCRRKGSSKKCGAGLIDVGGLCVGSAAIKSTTRQYCLSLLYIEHFRTATGICITNEMLFEDTFVKTKQISAAGNYTPCLECGTQLKVNGKCAINPYNVSARTGTRWDQVVYFNSADEPVFVGNCWVNHRDMQETYCSTPVQWHDLPGRTCSHAKGGLGWTKAWDYTGCVVNEWKANTTKCGPHAIHVEGKGGSQCFGYEKGAWMGAVNQETPWYTWNGAAVVAGPSAKEILSLPRVVIVPGEWTPERLDKLPVEEMSKVEAAITCDSFTNITSELLPCYCDVRTKGRLTTNGLCRRKGTSKCDSGLISIAGLCVGNAAVQPTTRWRCLSLLMFKTGACVANEMLYEDVKTTQITAAGPYSASLDCGNQLSGKCMCSNNPFNASIRAGMRADQVVYFNSADEPVFVGSCRGNHRNVQETYCSTPVDWYDGTVPGRMCKHARGGLGWTKSYDNEGCVFKEWRANTTKCGPQAIHVEGKGGSQCFGYEKGAWMSNVYYETPWSIYDGVKAGPGPSEKEWLALPRVVIVPGEWFPERVK